MPLADDRDRFITVENARLHNLRDVSLRIPKGELVVFTGISGSGKSTLAFDILFMEGLRQYLESAQLLAYGMTKPPVGAITGLAPTVSISQNLTNTSPRSTVGTVTDIYTYLRLLFARVGHRPCPECGQSVPPPYDEAPADSGDTGSVTRCPHCGARLSEIGMEHFSFNTVEGACPTCTGLGVVRRANVRQLVNDELSIEAGAVVDWDDFTRERHTATLRLAARHYGLHFDPALPVREYAPALRDLLVFGTHSPEFSRHFPEIKPPETLRAGKFEGVANTILRRYAEHVQDADYLKKLEHSIVEETCPDCGGARLKPESRAVTVGGKTIIELGQIPLKDLSAWLDALPEKLSGDSATVAAAILGDMAGWVQRVMDVGVDYLTLDRAAPTLSAGEAQRLKLASLLGSSLSGLLYVFDEPTTGLHARDTHRLISVMRRLVELGNTVLVVEHDLEVIAAADHVVDFGPGAGKHGGSIVAEGSPSAIAQSETSLTGGYLSGRLTGEVRAARRQPGETALVIHGARSHNLQNITARLPLGVLIAVTGVSGSGKSSLIFDILDKAGRKRFYGASDAPGEHDAIEGWEHVDRLITIDQQHIGRMARSNAATYTDAFTPIREAFARTPGARERGLASRHFSFNVPGGRCPRCEGAGVLTVSMHFLPDTEVVCPTCHGRRFMPDILAVTYHGRDIAEVLDMTIEEALALFADVPAAASRLQVMADVGLGYLQLGQPANTLSGGESQRVKLAKELGRRSAGRTLYLLDEPTTGLHPFDTGRLLALLQRLVDAGSSVIVVEHNLDVIRAADWILDLGPEGGSGGGQIVAEGPPEQVAEASGSYTGAWLRRVRE